MLARVFPSRARWLVETLTTTVPAETAALAANDGAKESCSGLSWDTHTGNLGVCEGKPKRQARRLHPCWTPKTQTNKLCPSCLWDTHPYQTHGNKYTTSSPFPASVMPRTGLDMTAALTSFWQGSYYRYFVETEPNWVTNHYSIIRLHHSCATVRLQIEGLGQGGWVLK